MHCIETVVDRPHYYIFHFKSFEISVVILLKVSNNVSCLISSQRINSGASAAAAAAGRCRADKLESGIIVWRGQAQAQSTSFYHNLKLKKVVHSFSGHLVVYISTWKPRSPRPFQQDCLQGARPANVLKLHRYLM